MLTNVSPKRTFLPTAKDGSSPPTTKKNAKGRCRFCSARLTNTFARLGMSPLANSYIKPEDLNRKEQFYPLHVYVCSECLLVQLEPWESPKRIFGDYPYFSSYSDTWLQHAKAYVAAVIERFTLDQQSHVVEVASNDGYLLQYFVQRGFQVLGVEPARNVAQAAKQAGVPTLASFFSARTAREIALKRLRADLLIANNVLAHVPNLNDFVRGLKIVLAPMGVLTLEFPHLMRLIEDCQIDTIYHEHFSYFSFGSAERVLAAHGLTVFDIEELPTHGGSIRIYARHTEASSPSVGCRVNAMRSQERQVGLDRLQHYLDFQDRVNETKRNILAFLIDVKRAGKRIMAYGAPAKGNTLLNFCGIRSDFIDCTVDRSPHKQHHFLPGSHIAIHSPERIKELKPDYLLILPWNLKSEIMEQTSFIRSWGGRFIVLVPRPEVIP